jgi:hypothetical protein
MFCPGIFWLPSGPLLIIRALVHPATVAPPFHKSVFFFSLAAYSSSMKKEAAVPPKHWDLLLN